MAKGTSARKEDKKTAKLTPAEKRKQKLALKREKKSKKKKKKKGLKSRGD